jgi:putative transposase
MAPKFEDLLRRGFSAPAPNRRWCGDMTEIPTDEDREVLVAWCLEFYNVRRRHSSAGLQPPADYEKPAADQPVAA